MLLSAHPDRVARVTDCIRAMGIEWMIQDKPDVKEGFWRGINQDAIGESFAVESMPRIRRTASDKAHHHRRSGHAKRLPLRSRGSIDIRCCTVIIRFRQRRAMYSISILKA